MRGEVFAFGSHWSIWLFTFVVIGRWLTRFSSNTGSSVNSTPSRIRIDSLLYAKLVKSAFKLSGQTGWRWSPVSVAWSDWEYFHSSLDNYTIARLPTSINFVSTHLYSQLERFTVRVKNTAKWPGSGSTHLLIILLPILGTHRFVQLSKFAPLFCIPT